MSSSPVEAAFPGSIVLDLPSLQCLSRGNDSNVYRIGDQVAKEYQRLSFEDAANYCALQNKAAVLLARNPYRAEIAIRGVPFSVRASEVVPVDRLAVSGSGRPLTFSRYVEAPNLEKLLWPPAWFKKYARNELSDPALRRFAFDLNNFFCNEYPTRVQDEFYYHVSMLSRWFDRELGVLGSYISKYNVKLRPGQEASGIDLIITDLALYIDRLAFRGKKERR